MHTIYQIHIFITIYLLHVLVFVTPSSGRTMRYLIKKLYAFCIVGTKDVLYT